MSEKNQYPKLYVKNFAKIKEAEIESAPFTLFVGDNNSGKSYLMTLIYHLFKYADKVIDIIFKDEKIVEELEEYKKAKYIIDNRIKTLDFDELVDMSAEEFNIFMDLFNVLLNKYSNEVINHIFNSSNEITLEYIKLELNDSNFTFRKFKSKKANDDTEFYYLGIKDINIGMGIGLSESKLIHIRDVEIVKNIIDFILNKSLEIYYRLFGINKTFLPVSRTGFLLSRNDIASSAIVDKFDRYAKKKNNEYLSRPIIDFLNNLNSLNNLSKEDNRTSIKKLNNIINFFEDNLISGKININAETGNIYYKPSNVNTEFQMYLSSAVITELAPLYLFLKYGIINGDLLMEEPEISLHPYLQQQLTRVFTKLVNINTHVLITTHSDTIIQHINNMIKLNSNNEERKKYLMNKYGYDEDDLISEDMVRMYQFDIEEDGFTKVTKLESSEYGFEVPTFNKVLKKISDEIYDFQEEL
ncbi:AAA family ATPase [Brachyspira intermedia]|uniref:AAA family ATPase n=1 Tax=Brachyspira intermedia TaxID=84377 RepID=UPI0030047BBD